MSRFFTLALATTLAACLGGAAWSQGGQAGGGAGAAGAQGTSGAAGGQSTPGAAGTAGAAGAAGQAGQIQSNVPGQAQFGRLPPSGADFGRISRTPFFNDQGVRQQLNLDENRFNALNRAYQESWNRYNQGLTGLDRNLNEQQRMQRMMQLENQFNQNFNRTLDTTFADPTLRQRYSQLNWQFQGFGAFNDPMVRQRLDITPQQQRQFRQLNAEWRRQMQRMQRAGNNSDPALTQQQFQQLQQQYQNQLRTLLTPQQQQDWASLIGQQYQYPPDIFFNEFRQDPGTVVPYSANRNGAGTGSQIGTQDTQVPSAADQDTQNDGTLR